MTSTDIPGMTTLVRPRLPLSTDFGNANSSARGSRAPKAVTLARRGRRDFAKLEHQPAVEIEPEYLAIRFTRQIRHSRLKML
jgi:hypothetical protein